ncbi:MAG: ribulose-phosphate 3-epimerase [Planctomycetota bacterium]|nr:ribulose-phosphate 3-epimerase [Planctomycetaceae bacterium]MDQ3330651.1 ribulose-phosphate 3-epimerase [Planctomycetota bacterium]
MNREDTIARLRGGRPVIAPSMLKCDYGNLNDEVARLASAGASVLHWDVMDGHFVPNLSYGAMVIAGMRDRSKLVFDGHLMISEPERYLDDYMKAGLDSITFHIEAVPEPASLLKRIRAAGKVAGLALNPETPAEAVLPFLNDCDMLLVMTVHPGFGGQQFMPDVLPKLAKLREAAGDRLISVDGGIAAETITAAATAGADVFVAGSAVFDAPDYGAAVTDLVRRASAAPRFSH